MAHCTTPEAEQLLDKEIPVLDKGFIRLVDYMGSDDRIVQAARVSYGAGTKSYREDRGLIHYLLRNAHTSPFEQVVLTFHTKMPVFVARQWVRHRTARLNEISGRYSIMKDEFFVPSLDGLAAQSADNKQGRDEQPLPEEQAKAVQDSLIQEQAAAFQLYNERIEQGLARELCRVNLPLSLYTEWYWQIDLHNLFHFLKLRMDHHAQAEIRAYAEAMFEVVKAVCPLAAEAFEQHVLGAVQFSAQEFAALKRHLVESGSAEFEGVSAAAKEQGMQSRETERLLDKLRTGRNV